MNICLLPNLAYLSGTSRAIEIYKSLIKQGESLIVAKHDGKYEMILQEEKIP